MSKNSGLFASLSKGQLFLLGIVGGVMVLCTIGFFVMLGVYFSGDHSQAGSGPILSAITEAPEKFSQCLDEGKYAATVKADMNLGASLGVNGTPATFINGYLISGALPYDAIKQVIDVLLAGQEPNFDFMKDKKTGEIVKVDMPELPDAIWRGNEKAGVTLVEFSDFECPYCVRFTPTIDQVLADYGDKVKFTYRHFPLSLHAQAQKAAEAFECAKEQNKGFEMHDKLFELSDSQQLSVANFKKAASELGLK